MEIDKAYDIWSAQYDSNINKTRDLDIKSTIETLDKIDFSRVIELGCGTGKNTQYLIKKAELVIALDFSQEMLNIAKKKIKDHRVDFRKANITKNWDIENNFANLITSSLVLEHIEDLGFIFTQANMKLKDGGHFFISELHPFKQYTGSKARYEDENGIHELKTYVHHTSEYINHAINNGFQLIELKELFDSDNKIEIPRLIGLLFRKIS